MLSHDHIIIVSGLPRSGTSMMMQMLRAGGIEIVYDHFRPADTHNPEGYFELDKVKKLEQDNSWLAGCKGKAIKVLFHLLKFLPEDLTYKIIFMNRHLTDTILSQNKMLNNHAKSLQDDDKILSIFTKELNEIFRWLKNQPHMEILFVQYEHVISDPRKGAHKVTDFLAAGTNATKMTSVIKKKKN